MRWIKGPVTSNDVPQTFTGQRIGTGYVLLCGYLWPISITQPEPPQPIPVRPEGEG